LACRRETTCSRVNVSGLVDVNPVLRPTRPSIRATSRRHPDTTGREKAASSSSANLPATTVATELDLISSIWLRNWPSSSGVVVSEPWRSGSAAKPERTITVAELAYCGTCISE